MSEKYLKVILISAVGGLWMIAYGLFIWQINYNILVLQLIRRTAKTTSKVNSSSDKDKIIEAQA